MYFFRADLKVIGEPAGRCVRRKTAKTLIDRWMNWLRLPLYHIVYSNSFQVLVVNQPIVLIYLGNLQDYISKKNNQGFYFIDICIKYFKFAFDSLFVCSVQMYLAWNVIYKFTNNIKLIHSFIHSWVLCSSLLIKMQMCRYDLY